MCAGRLQVKFLYDHVFQPLADNRTVYKTVASPIVRSALDGINGTIFACQSRRAPLPSCFDRRPLAGAVAWAALRLPANASPGRLCAHGRGAAPFRAAGRCAPESSLCPHADHAVCAALPVAQCAQMA